MDKPIHVQVAEALGCNSAFRKAYRGDKEEQWCCEDGDHRDPTLCEPWLDSPDVARFDLDWCATGPLVERHKIALEWHPLWAPPGWCAVSEDGGWIGSADSPLLAICRLIIELGKAGKL